MGGIDYSNVHCGAYLEIRDEGKNPDKGSKLLWSDTGREVKESVSRVVDEDFTLKDYEDEMRRGESIEL